MSDMPTPPPLGPDPAAPPHTKARSNVAAVEAMYQLVLWLVPVLDGLPRRQKFQLGDRLQTTALDVLDTLIEAAYTRARLGCRSPGGGQRRARALPVQPAQGCPVVKQADLAD